MIIRQITYPNTSVLSAKDLKLYIGMRQFDAELDIQTGKLRYPLQSLESLAELSEFNRGSEQKNTGDGNV